MAHDFAGTFNNHGFGRLSSFLVNQANDVPGRVVHLLAERNRIGSLQFTFDSGGNPVGYSANPQTSYIGKLMAAYEILGGDPIFDLNIRTMGQPVFLIAGTETTPAQQLSSGDILGTPGKRDQLSATLVQQMRSWAPDVIQYKRENIERKIRRAVDYSDSLYAEIQQLAQILNDANTPTSLAAFTAQINTLLADPTYRPISNDTTGDLWMKRSNAPFSQYDPGPSTTVPQATVRGDGGVSIQGNSIPQGSTPAASPNNTSGSGSGTA